MPSTLGPIAGMQVRVLSTLRKDREDRSRVFLLSLSQGVLYDVEVASKSLMNYSLENTDTFLFLAEIIREDGTAFFAFESLSERDLFLKLKEIDSIGNKTAALALRELGVQGLRQLLLNGPSVVGKVPGLGPKTMEKLRNGLQTDRVEFEKLFSNCLRPAPRLKLHFSQFGVSSPTNLDLSTAESSTALSSGLSEVGEQTSIPPVVIQALVKLGVSGPDVLTLFDELVSESSGVLQDEPEILIRKLLAKWSRSRNKKSMMKTEKGI